MKVLIYGKEMPHSIDCANAYFGFEEMGAEIVLMNNWFDLTAETLRQFDCCVGGVSICRCALHTMGLRNFDISCYPAIPSIYYGRTIIEDTIANYNEHKNAWIKPQKPKLFTAAKNIGQDISHLMYQHEDSKIWVCDVVEFVSEWRCYIRNNEIQGVVNYAGDPKRFPSINIIKNMIYHLIEREMPICYALDVGIMKNSATVIVEVNDFYAVGNYGLFPISYAEMLLLRWQELLKGITIDNKTT